jgi:hypothetical protein
MVYRKLNNEIKNFYNFFLILGVQLPYSCLCVYVPIVHRHISDQSVLDNSHLCKLHKFMKEKKKFYFCTFAIRICIRTVNDCRFHQI